MRLGLCHAARGAKKTFEGGLKAGPKGLGEIEKKCRHTGSTIWPQKGEEKQTRTTGLLSRTFHQRTKP